LKLVLLPEAEADLDEAIDHHIEVTSAAVAADLRHEVQRVAALLSDWPHLGHKVGSRARAFGLKRFPYQLVYRLTAEALVVVAIAHEKRDPRYWRGRA
jgi:toxin ParE1/3/4